MGWMGCVCCEKLQRDFVAQTFALIALVHYVLQQVSCSYETIPNAPKYYETHQNISLWCNGADWVHSLWKILMWLRGTNFYIKCTSSPRFAPSFMQLRNDNKCTQTLWNAPKHEFRVQWGWIGWIRCKKLGCEFVARTFTLIAPVQPVLHRVSCSNKTIQNTPKYYKTHQYMS